MAAVPFNELAWFLSNCLVSADALPTVFMTGQFMRSTVLFCTLLAVLAIGASQAFAQGVGFQGGVSIDPERVYFGSHVETGEIARGLHVRPAIEAAVGGNVTITSVNLDFLYKRALGASWKIYQGGGPVVHVLRGGDPAQIDVTGGLAGLFGFAHDPTGFFVEIRAGGRAVALKFGVGLTIR